MPTADQIGCAGALQSVVSATGVSRVLAAAVGGDTLPLATV